MAITIVSWNIAKRRTPWRQLLEMDADIALLQEAVPPDDVAGLPLDVGPRESWDSHSWNRHRRPSALYDRWPMVVRLSDRVDVEWFTQVGPIGWPKQDEIAVRGIGTITAARVTPQDGSIQPFIVVSMYGRWVGLHPSLKTSRREYADASVHRIISDLSAFIGENPQTHRILAAGDLNIFHGYGDWGSPYWEARYRSVFERMDVLGLEFVGSQAPFGRRAAEPREHEPTASRNVVTFYPPRRNPATAIHQLDFAFASRGFHESLRVCAMNGVDE